MDTMKPHLPQREIHERKKDTRSLPSILLARGVTNDSFAKTITIVLSPGAGDDRRERKYVMPDEKRGDGRRSIEKKNPR